MNHSQTVHASFNPVPSPFGGLIVRPGDDGWDKARQAWNLAVDQQPAAVAEFRHLGSALSEATLRAGALASIDATYAMYAGGIRPLRPLCV